MRRSEKTALLLAILSLGGATTAFGQGRGYYGRVTTSSREVLPETSSRTAIGRGGNLAGVAYATRSGIRADSLHAYSERALERARNPQEGVPRSSTWRQEPLPPDEPPPVTVQTRSRNYFPTMRPGLAFQQPVTLTATPYIGHICTCTRSGIIAGTGHHR